MSTLKVKAVTVAKSDDDGNTWDAIEPEHIPDGGIIIGYDGEFYDIELPDEAKQINQE